MERQGDGLARKKILSHASVRGKWMGRYRPITAGISAVWCYAESGVAVSAVAVGGTQNTFGLSVAPLVLSRFVSGPQLDRSPVAPPEARIRPRSAK